MLKSLLKKIYILTFLSFISFGFASAASNTSSTSCYWKNHSYQCTTKTCKTAKSCTYKTIKATPPKPQKTTATVTKPQTTATTTTKIIDTSFTSKTCNAYIDLMKCVISKNPENRKIESISMLNDVIKQWQKLSSSELKSTCDTTIEQLYANRSSFESIWCSIWSSSWYIYTWSNTWSKITPISNTENTISNLSTFIDAISWSILTGNSGSRYSLLEFGDFQCPFCQKFHNKNILQNVMSNYSSNINYYFLNYPLSFHEKALPLAKWYICTYNQSKDLAVKYIKNTYEQTIWDANLYLSDWSKNLPNSNEFLTCLDSSWTLATIKYQQSIADYIGVQWTPTTMLINNETSEYEVVAWAYESWAYVSIIENRQDQLKKYPYNLVAN